MGVRGALTPLPLGGIRRIFFPRHRTVATYSSSCVEPRLVRLVIPSPVSRRDQISRSTTLRLARASFRRSVQSFSHSSLRTWFRNAIRTPHSATPRKSAYKLRFASILVREERRLYAETSSYGQSQPGHAGINQGNQHRIRWLFSSGRYGLLRFRRATKIG